MFLAGIATFTLLYCPQLLLPSFSEASAAFALILPPPATAPAGRRAHAGSPTGAGRALADPGLLRLYAVGLLLMGGFVTVYN